MTSLARASNRPTVRRHRRSLVWYSSRVCADDSRRKRVVKKYQKESETSKGEEEEDIKFIDHQRQIREKYMAAVS